MKLPNVPSLSPYPHESISQTTESPSPQGQHGVSDTSSRAVKEKLSSELSLGDQSSTGVNYFCPSKQLTDFILLEIFITYIKKFQISFFLVVVFAVFIPKLIVEYTLELL